ncbi:MAG: hypothetical protein IPP34_17215 [Bacteroidetes bacterium]|nr:hypothetical protein [Bacteroidota bacterium]
MPGSNYKFDFILPDANATYEFFLYSKGYYLEWMREHWLKDKDLLNLNRWLIIQKVSSGRSKILQKYESTMEEEFWNSKVDTKAFSYYEN